MDFLHIPFEDLDNYFQNTGECHVLRFDWIKEDKNWSIIESFIPDKVTMVSM